MGFDPSEYSDVAERITLFYERYPEGALTTEPPYVLEIAGKPFICCHAKAYRTPDDKLPGDGLAWEPVPGPTQFTKDSELMNAQTAALGRAIVALGFQTKKIASRQEVQARQGNGDGPGPDPHGLQASRADAVEPGQVLVTFGKHKGKKVADVPRSYWEWWLSQDGQKNPELLAAVELHLGLQATPDDTDGLPF